jgi:hypothetical protein
MQDRYTGPRRRVAACVVTGWLSVCGAVSATEVPSPSGSPPAAKPGPATAGLVAGGDEPTLFLASTGDVIGYVDPCG